MTSHISESSMIFFLRSFSCIFFLFFDDMPVNRRFKKGFKIEEKDGEGNNEECINPADVEHGSLIDINGTLFVVEIRPVFHTDRGA